MTLTSIAAEVYNTLFLNRIKPGIKRILRKNRNGFQKGVRAKNLEARLIFVDFYKKFNSIHKEKMEQILLAFGFPKETHGYNKKK